MKIILASKSPRRKELIGYLFDNVEIQSSDVEENYPEALPFDEIPAFLAALKARAVANNEPDALVIGADTGVFADLNPSDDHCVCSDEHAFSDRRRALALMSLGGV